MVATAWCPIPRIEIRINVDPFEIWKANLRMPQMLARNIMVDIAAVERGGGGDGVGDEPTLFCTP